MAARGGGLSFPEFLARVSATMPPFAADRPAPQSFVDILAYLSHSLGSLPGSTDATPQSPAFRTALVPRKTARNEAVATPAGNLGWGNWRGPVEGTAYSPADQIRADNVKSLRIAWRWSSAGMGPAPEVRNSSTPLMIDGILYVTAGLPRNVVAIDAKTGETLWMWRAGEDPARLENAPRKGSGRGVAYWTDGKRDRRIFTVTPGFQLAALDALTGQPVAGFGRNGKVNLMQGLRGASADSLPDIGNSSPPLVIGDVVVVGPAHEVAATAQVTRERQRRCESLQRAYGKAALDLQDHPGKGRTWL